MSTTTEVKSASSQPVGEELYHRLVALLPAAVYACDAEGVITLYNRRAAELWGRVPRLGDTDERFCGSYRLYYPGGAPLPHDQTPMAEAIRTGRPAHDREVVIERPDGSIITVLVNIDPLFDEQGQIAGAVNVFQDISERVRLWQENQRQRQLLEETVAALNQERTRLKELAGSLEERVMQRTAQVRALAAALSLAEQRERVHLSEILHDDLQQLLYSQLMRLEVLRQRLPAGQEPALDDLIAGMVEQMDQAVRVTRALAAELNPPPIESSDLGESLRWLADHMAEAHALKVTLSANGSGKIDHDETRSLLLQMVRELLFNVVKHAGVHEAQVELQRENGLMAILVKDDGVGFDPARLQASQKEPAGIGLLSISERLALIGGRLELDAAPGRGTRVTIFAPVVNIQ